MHVTTDTSKNWQSWRVYVLRSKICENKRRAKAKTKLVRAMRRLKKDLGKNRKKERQERGWQEVEANCRGRAALGVHRGAIPRCSKGHSGAVGHTDLELDCWDIRGHTFFNPVLRVYRSETGHLKWCWPVRVQLQKIEGKGYLYCTGFISLEAVITCSWL